MTLILSHELSSEIKIEKYIYIFIERITSNTEETLGESSPPGTEGKETDII